MSDCATCGSGCAECQDPYGSYSVVGQSYLNGVTGLDADCPPGFICGPGGPPWDPPPPPPPDPTCPNPPCGGGGGGGGGGFTLPLEGCESTIVRSIPAGISEADYNAILVEMLQERADQQVRCDEFPGIPNPGATKNDQQCVPCGDDSPMTQLAQLPQGVAVINNQLCVRAGLFTATSRVFNGVTYPTFKEAVNARALAYATQTLADALEFEQVSCGVGCGSGSLVQIQGFTTGMFGTWSAYSLVLTGTGPTSAWPIIGAFTPPANWVMSNLGGGAGGYVLTTAGNYAYAPTGFNSGFYAGLNECTGGGVTSPPVFLYNGLGAPFTDVYDTTLQSPWGGSSNPAWDGQFTLEDEDELGMCVTHTNKCGPSLGSLAGWGIHIQYIADPGNDGFHMEIYGYSDSPTGIQVGDLLWYGFYATTNDQEPVGTYLSQHIGAALIDPASITLEVPPP